MKLVVFMMILLPTCTPNSEDLYNTKTATSDLHWTAYPPQKGWEEISGRDRDGRIIRYYQVCNYDNTEVDNWVRTPFIQSRGAKRAHITVEFSMRKCDDIKSDCRETFSLYYFQSYTDIASSTFPPWRKNPYVKIDTVAAGERFGSVDAGQAERVNYKNWTIGPLTRNGFYIAAQDQGACMSILSLRVYYFYCPQVTENLASFPRTVSSHKSSSLVKVSGRCQPNSRATKGPQYHCSGNGQWIIPTGSCQCNPGYEANPSRTVCTMCSAGSYKSSYDNHACIRCPGNSESSQRFHDEADGRSVMDHCTCLPGHYRAAGEDVHSSCSAPPTAPINIRCDVNVTSVDLSWQRPSSNGGRSDLYYNITCQQCSLLTFNNRSQCFACSDDVTFRPANHERLLATECRVKNLRPYTAYKFKIYAMNGVTSSSRLVPAHETVSIVTKEGVPSRIEKLRGFSKHPGQLTLSWSRPQRPNGNITKYELVWLDKEDVKAAEPIGIIQTKSPSRLVTTGNNITISDVTPGHTYSVRIKAATTAGFGPFSDSFDVYATPSDGSGLGSPMPGGILVGTIATVSLLSTVLAAWAVYYFKKRRGLFAKNMTDTLESEETIALHASLDQVSNPTPPADSGHQIYIDYPDPYRAVQEFACEIDPSNLTVGECIGQGEFGEVRKGLLHHNGTSMDVAVKRMKGGSADQFNFLREASAMAQFTHINVIELKGVVTKSHPFMIITEFMGNGSLDVFLQKKKNQLTIIQLVEMLRGIASGMRYLSIMKYIHRDLAARNILVDSDLVCKVSDFGLSRNLENDPHATYTTQGGKIAIRWTAPECIRSRKFTSASDVWSFGIVMWEVTSYGEKPYWEMTNQEVMLSIDKGYRLPSPQDCPLCLHHLMMNCWAIDPKMRPTMDDVHRRLGNMLQRPNSLARVAHKRHTATNPANPGA